MGNKLAHLDGVCKCIREIFRQYFVDADDSVPQKIVVHKDGPRGIRFGRAGPCQKVHFESDEVHACIVTCGDLCPGFITVIREIVSTLSYMYGVNRILGKMVDIEDSMIKIRFRWTLKS